jgi:hypothetical protein
MKNIFQKLGSRSDCKYSRCAPWQTNKQTDRQSDRQSALSTLPLLKGCKQNVIVVHTNLTNRQTEKYKRSTHWHTIKRIKVKTYASTISISDKTMLEVGVGVNTAKRIACLIDYLAE